jgi:heme-degrading monooxygenase HmoA
MRMVLELAEIVIRPGEQQAFDAAIAHGVAGVISRCPGFQRATVHKGIESPERYLLQIQWDTLESHTVAFRGPATRRTLHCCRRRLMVSARSAHGR